MPNEHATAVDRTRACLDAIEDWNETVNAMVTVVGEAALADARRLDAMAAEGHWAGLLHGVPIVLKDNIETAGIRTTNGSLFFASHVPNRDAPAVQRLRRAGAVIVGKASLHEFAFGSRSYNPVSGQCRNPWNTERIPGGSSGGSGVAVATGMCQGALGTDTGGSVRMPAALNGVTGLRPTIGRIPNCGVMAVSPTHDTIGPMARTAADVARIFAVIAGHDPLDPICENRPLENFLPRLNDAIAGVRIGLPRNHYFDGADPQVEQAVRQAARTLAELGAELVEIDVPGAESAQDASTVIIFCDACLEHAERLEGPVENWAVQTIERLRKGLDFSGTDYARALRGREAWRATLRRVFSEVDVILSPTVPIVAPPIEDAQSLFEATRAVTRNTYAAGLGGNPGLSLPCGQSSDGLPIGVQLEAAWWREPLVLRLGVAFQAATRWHMQAPQRPSIATKGEQTLRTAPL